MKYVAKRLQFRITKQSAKFVVRHLVTESGTEFPAERNECEMWDLLVEMSAEIRRLEKIIHNRLEDVGLAQCMVGGHSGAKEKTAAEDQEAAV